MFIQTFIAILSILSLSTSDQFQYEDHVLVLTESNFEEAQNQFPDMLVEFYAPWCGHCKSLAPEYAKAAQQLEESGSQVKLAKVDATVHKKLGEQFEVKGFPTLKFFKQGNVVEYNGGRTADTIISWITKRMGEQSTEVTKKSEIEGLVTKSVVVAYFGEKNDQFTEFLGLAEQMEEVVFIHSFDPKFKSEMNASIVTIFKSFDDLQNNFDGEFDIEKVADFVTVNSLKTIMDFDQSSAQAIFSGQQNTLFFMFSQADDKSNAIRTVLETVAPKLKGKVLMCATQVAEGFGARLGEFLGVPVDTAPIFYIIKFQNEDLVKYRMEQEISEQSILQFVEDVNSGVAQAFRKSEEIPAVQDGPVTVVVGKNFDQIVMDENKDVLVEFYAPWCGHCKTLEPKYVELAKLFAGNQHVVIAKMDSTANEVPQVTIQSFPTIKLFVRGKKSEPIDYTGEREIEQLAEFVKQNTQFIQHNEEL